MKTTNKNKLRRMYNASNTLGLIGNREIVPAAPHDGDDDDWDDFIDTICDELGDRA